MNTLLLTLHIIAAGVWIGANVVQFVTTNRLAAQGGVPAATWMETVTWWGRVVYSPAAVLLLITGVGLVIDSTFYEFSNTFVSIGFAAIIAGAAIGITQIGKGSERAAAAFNAGDDAAGRAAIAKYIPWAIVDSLIILVAVIAMVAKWGA